MKSVGKIAALAMAFALAGALTACGGSAASSSATASSASTSASASSASASTASSQASSQFNRGSVEGDTYSNEMFGVKYVLPEGYRFQDETYLAQLNALAEGFAIDEVVAEVLQGGSAYFDMAALADDNSSVTAVIEYANAPEAQALDEAAYLASSVDLIKKQLEQAGATVSNVSTEAYTNPSTGDVFQSMTIDAASNGVDFHEKILCLKKGDYFMNITATSSDKDALNAMLNGLTKL